MNSFGLLRIVLLVAFVSVGCAGPTVKPRRSSEVVPVQVSDRSEEMRVKVQSSISNSSLSVEGACQSYDGIVNSADKIAKVYGTTPETVRQAAQEAFEVFRSTSGGAVDCSANRICSVVGASECVRSVYSKCVLELANILAKKYDRGIDEQCVDDQLLSRSQTDVCLVSLMPNNRRQEHEDAFSRYRECFCTSLGGRLIGWSNSSDLEMQWNQSLHRQIGKCPVSEIGDIGAINRSAVWGFLSKQLYEPGIEGAGEFFSLLGYLRVEPSLKDFSKFLKSLSKRNPDYQADFLDAVLAGSVGGLSDGIRRGVCDASLRKLDVSRELEASQVSNLFTTCEKQYSTWVKSKLDSVMRRKMYGDALQILGTHLSSGELAGSDWAIKARQTIESDLAKSRTLMAEAANVCSSGSRKGLDMLKVVKGYGVLEPDVAAARQECLLECDRGILADIREKLESLCKNGESVLLGHVKLTRGAVAAKNVQKILGFTASGIEGFQNALTSQLGQECSQALVEGGTDVFKCKLADEKLLSANAALSAMDVPTAFRFAMESEAEYRRPGLVEFAAKAKGLIAPSLYSRAEGAYSGGLIGLGWLYQVILDRLFPEDGQRLMQAYPDVGGSLASIVSVRKYMNLNTAFTSGQMGARLAPLLGDYLSARISNGLPGGGLPVILNVRRVDSKWSASKRDESRVHKYVATRSVPNSEKREACEAVPRARSAEAAAQSVMQQAEHQCRRLARATQQNVGTGFLGGLVGGLVNAGCSVAAQELLYNQARERRDKLEYMCNALPAYVDVNENKEYRYSGTWYFWEYQTAVAIDIVNQAGEVICTVQDGNRSELRDLTFNGRSEVGLPSDQLDEPAHDAVLKANFDTLVNQFPNRVDKCIAENLSRFVDGQIRASVSSGTSQDRDIEKFIRNLGAKTRSIPDYNQLESIIERILPVSQMHEFMSRHGS
ncbi:MAG TPA: hypothetical protein PLB35_09235 [Myxococcota bacterium]|nr:hypothetical protein [Myxococcota bacterium]